MSKKQLKLPYGANRAIKTGLGVAVGVLLTFGLANWAFAGYLENFDAYNPGDRLNLGTGDWVDIGDTGQNLEVVDTEAVSAPNSARLDDAGYRARLEIPEASRETEVYFDVMLENCGSFYTNIALYNESETYFAELQTKSWTDPNCMIRGKRSGGWEEIGNVNLNEWNTWGFQSDTIEGNPKVRFTIDGGDTWTDWLNPQATIGNIKWFTIYSNSPAKAWFDNIIFGEPETDLRVWVSAPESGSTTTAIDDSFTINWINWDFDWIYQDFIFSFWQKDTGIVVGQQTYEPTAESGSVSYNFSDFDIDKNGQYHFSAKARSYLHDYTAYYSSELVDPDWYVIIDIEGWDWIFEMPEFYDWYGENVDRFATPTAVFSGVTGLFNPIFSRIGEFGNRVIGFLDVGEAYETGYGFGTAIPVFRHYVSEIEKFFGGFPIVTIFLVLMSLMIGIFIFKLILKFIPGLGG